MKLRDFDHIRRTELLAILLTGFLADKGVQVGNIDMSTINSIVNGLYYVDFFTSFRTARLTSDYKEMSDLYNSVISSTTDLINEFGLENPVEIFSFYVYLYRGGFLSHNGDFEYNMDLKDLPGLYGVDVIRGKGVCRTISSMLVDIYRNLDFEASNLVVCATEKSIYDQQQLCDFPKKKNIKHPELMNIFIPISEGLRLGNHQITHVKDGDINYILDPTNDGMLQVNVDNGTFYAGNKSSVMYPKIFSQLSANLIGTEKYDFIKTDSEKTISDELYREIYLSTLELCRSNLSSLKEFAYKNRNIYKDLNNLAEEQRGLMGRAFPIVPKNIKQKTENLKRIFLKNDLD